MLPALVIQAPVMFARMAAISTLAPTGSAVVDPRVSARFPGPFAIDFIFQFSRVSHIEVRQ